MARPRSDYDVLLKSADRFELELARRIRAVMLRRRSSIMVAELGLALEAKDVKRALAAIGEKDLAGDMEGVRDWLKKVLLHGGKLGADAVNREVKARSKGGA